MLCKAHTVESASSVLAQHDIEEMHLAPYKHCNNLGIDLVSVCPWANCMRLVGGHVYIAVLFTQIWIHVMYTRAQSTCQEY